MKMSYIPIPKGGAIYDPRDINKGTMVEDFDDVIYQTHNLWALWFQTKQF